MGPTVSWVFDSTNSAIDSASREKSPASIWVESVLRSQSSGRDYTDVGERVDAKEGEGVLGFSEFEVTEEKVRWVWVEVVLDEGGGEEGEF